jgi:hypothetical protein
MHAVDRRSRRRLSGEHHWPRNENHNSSAVISDGYELYQTNSVAVEACMENQKAHALNRAEFHR